MRLAIGQMCAAARHAPNIAVMQDLAAEAAEAGANILCLPEMAGLMNQNGAEVAALLRTDQPDPYHVACAEAAARHGLWMQPGSTAVPGPDGKFFNRAVMIDPEGREVAHYDKIHLFDVALDGEEPFGESRRYAPGQTGVVVSTPLARFGMAICYDVRFARLFRDYAQAGADVLFVPAAFTVPTGRAHWELLLRARAVETGSFVVAAAQSGSHEDGRATWGHSLVIDPWGRILADLGTDAPGLAVVDIDLSLVTAARRQIPALEHDRPYSVTPVSAH